MNRRTMLLAAVAAGMSLSTVAAPARAEDAKPGRIRIGVLDLRESPGVLALKGAIGRDVANTIRQRLQKTGRFDMVDRQDMEVIIKQQKIDVSGIVDDSTAVSLGKQLGINYLIYGDVEACHLQQTGTVQYPSLRASVRAYFKAVDVQTGRMWAQGKYNAERYPAAFKVADPHELIDRAVGAIVDDFVKSLPMDLSGAIVDIDKGAGLFVINLGSGMGLTEKTKIKVMRVGKEIKDPKTGEVLAREKDLIAEGTVKQILSDKAARVELTKDKKKGIDLIQVGDLVEIVNGK